MLPLTHRTARRRRSQRGGFSLVELLFVVGLIGVLASIAIGIATGINSAAEDAKNRRNAQFAASVYASAHAAGASFSSEAGDVEGVIRELNEGKAGQGNLSAAYFRLPTMPIGDTGSMVSLLVYDPASGGLMMKVDP